MSNTQTQTITEAQAIFDKAQADVKSPYHIITKEEWAAMKKADYDLANCANCACFIKPGHARRTTEFFTDYLTQEERWGYVFTHKGQCWLDHCRKNGHDGYDKSIPEESKEVYDELLAIIEKKYEEQYNAELAAKKEEGGA